MRRTQSTAASMSQPARKTPRNAGKPVVVERVQTGLRIEKRMLKVLKALAEYHDLTLGDLVEGVMLHALEGRCAFGKDSLQRIAAIKKVYGLDLDASAAHRLVEAD